MMTGVNFNYGINTDKERADLLEYERRVLVETESPTIDFISIYDPGLWEQIDRILMGIDDEPQPVNLTPGALGVRCEE